MPRFSGQDDQRSAGRRCPAKVLVSDNGSTDDTRRIAEQYADRLPGLRVLDAGERPGAGYARNAAAATSTADFLVFCDADDEVAPDWLEQMTSALQRASFVAGRLDASAENLGIRRSVFASVGGVDPEVRILEDTDLSWRVQAAGTPLVFARDAVVHVRLRATFSGMWRQGWGCGHAQAQLEERFGPAEPASEAPRGIPGRVAGLGRLVREHPSPEALAWVLGWHVGHRHRAEVAQPDGRVPAGH